jgi:hypothetical protein
MPIVVGTGGLLATRYLSGLVLKEKDATWMGYAASAGIAIVGFIALRKFKNKLAMPWLVGSGIGIALRAASQFIPGFASQPGINGIMPAPAGGLGAIYSQPAGLGMPYAAAY